MTGPAASGAGDPRRWLVYGAGSFGTAMAHVLSVHEVEITLAARTEAQAAELREGWTNERYFPGMRLPEELEVTTIDELAGGSWDVAVLAVPTTALPGAVVACEPLAPTLLSLAKGFAPDGRRMSEVAAEQVDPGRFVVLSGPNIAWELMQDLPAAAVVSGHDMVRAERIQQAMTGMPLRVYLNDDLLGVELAGACKNVVAIAAGICLEAKIGTNGLAAVMTRGMMEVARLGLAMGARTETFLGLAGMGDLITTIGSEHSRNRKAGRLLADGLPADEVAREVGQVVEGLRAAPIVSELGRRHGVPMRVCDAVARLADGASTLPDVLMDLVSRPAGWEFRGGPWDDLHGPPGD